MAAAAERITPTMVNGVERTETPIDVFIGELERLKRHPLEVVDKNKVLPAFTGNHRVFQASFQAFVDASNDGLSRNHIEKIADIIVSQPLTEKGSSLIWSAIFNLIEILDKNPDQISLDFYRAFDLNAHTYRERSIFFEEESSVLQFHQGVFVSGTREGTKMHTFIEEGCDVLNKHFWVYINLKTSMMGSGILIGRDVNRYEERVRVAGSEITEEEKEKIAEDVISESGTKELTDRYEALSRRTIIELENLKRERGIV